MAAAPNPIQALVDGARRIPWARVMAAATALLDVNRRFQENLTDKQREELRGLLIKGTPDPRKLTSKQLERIRVLVVKGATGKKPR